VDYDPTQQLSINFFKTIRNNLKWAITGNTAAEIIQQRAYSDQPDMDLTNCRGSKPSKQVDYYILGLRVNKYYEM